MNSDEIKANVNNGIMIKENGHLVDKRFYMLVSRLDNTVKKNAQYAFTGLNSTINTIGNILLN